MKLTDHQKRSESHPFPPLPRIDRAGRLRCPERLRKAFLSLGFAEQEDLRWKRRKTILPPDIPSAAAMQKGFPIIGLVLPGIMCVAAAAADATAFVTADASMTPVAENTGDGGYVPLQIEEAWPRLMLVVSKDWPLARVTPPRADTVPARSGRIESGWVSGASAESRASWPHWPTQQERLVLTAEPTASGTWITARVQVRSFGNEPSVGGVREASWDLAGSAEDWPAITEERNVTGSLIARVAMSETVVEGIEYLPPLDRVPTAMPRDTVPWEGSRMPRLSRAWHVVAEDYRNFYSCENLTCLTAVFGAGALMANTGFDQTVQTAWQQSVKPSDLGTFFSGCKDIGEGRYALAVFGTAAATGYLFEGRPAGDVVGAWGERSLRIFVVAGPPVYALQWATGASRPDESSAGSRWKAFQDNNGVSGHAFVGAIPFLAAAGMVENPWAKGGLYVCSTFAAFSRVTDNAHYPSQVFLGWSLAVAGSLAVDHTDFHFAGREARIVPVVFAEGTGLGFEMEW